MKLYFTSTSVQRRITREQVPEEVDNQVVEAMVSEIQQHVGVAVAERVVEHIDGDARQADTMARDCRFIIHYLSLTGQTGRHV